MKKHILSVLIYLLGTTALSAGTDSISRQGSGQVWGRLANPGYENQPIKSAFFFCGSSRNGVQYYEYYPAPNTGLYTIHPSDARHLKWSENAANREFAINTMIQAGINVINMSYWGPRGTDNWAWWAPMQTSTYSHDELFETTLDKDILIVPYIESAAATPGSPGFSFMDCFPGNPANPAPEFVAILKDLIQRYLLSPQNTRWPTKWARVYDQSGNERYVISIIHAASNQDGITDQLFAEGFDRIANKIFDETGVLVGFTLDALPPATYASGQFKPSPTTTGPWLVQQESILAIQCFIPEISLGVTDEDYLLEWKSIFSSMWIHTGIPFIQDISPGYDANIVFPGSVIYGNTESWRNALGQIVLKLKSQGMTFSAWNGYTEGYAGVPTDEYGTDIYEWAGDLFKNFETESRHPIPGKIQAEDYAQMAGIQIQTTDDDMGGLNVGWMDIGDWIDYQVDVCETDTYYVDLRVAIPNDLPKGRGQIKKGNQVLASFSIPGTGGWQSWKTTQTTVKLETGEQTLRLLVTIGDWNINWMKFRLDPVEKCHELPGRIEAEHYADMFGIKTERSMDDGGRGLNIGWFDAGDWLLYDIDVKEDGDYDLSLRVALDNAMPGQGTLLLDNTTLCTFDVPVTGGWQTWKTLPKQVFLSAGQHKLLLYVIEGPWNLDWMEFAKTSSYSRAPGWEMLPAWRPSSQ